MVPVNSTTLYDLPRSLLVVSTTPGHPAGARAPIQGFSSVLADPNSSSLDVVAAWATFDGQGGIKAPKNGKPRRIVLPPPALRTLGMVPRPLNQDDTIFHTARGRRLTKGTLRVSVASVRRGAARPHPTVAGS